MSETKIEIDLTKVLPTKVTRTLKEDQILCPTCQGVGLIRQSDERGEYIVGCPKCHARTYMVKCRHCGEAESGYSSHSCDGTRQQRALETERREQEKWDKAEKISYAEACKRYEQVVVGWDTYLPVGDVLDHIADGWIESGERDIPRVWGTYEKSLLFDARDVIANSLDDSYEDACVSEQDESELKEFLDEWCKRASVVNSTMTYYTDEKVAIVVTEQDVLDDYPELQDIEGESDKP